MQQNHTSLSTAIMAFLSHLQVEKSYSQATISAYRRDLEQFTSFLAQEEQTASGNSQQAESLGTKSLTKLSSKSLPEVPPQSGEPYTIKPCLVEKRQVQKFLVWLHLNHSNKSSIARKLSSLRSFFNYLLRLGQIEQLPTQGIKNPKQEKRQPTIINVDQAFALLDVKSIDQKTLSAKPEINSGQTVQLGQLGQLGQAGQPAQSGQKKADLSPRALAVREAIWARDLALLELLYGSGLRISEALGLELKATSPSSGFVRVMGKGSKERQVPLSHTSQEALERWIALRPTLMAESGEHKPETALFVGNRGSRLNRRQANRILKDFCLQAGLPQVISAHSLRHSFATHLLQGGANMRSVQELLGHSRISTTQRYTHLNLTQLMQVYDKAHPKGDEKEKKLKKSEKEV